VKLLFIGQAPSRESDGQPPFTGRCGKFLAQLMGITHESMLREFDFTNVLDYWPGKGPGGDLFPIKLAQEEAVKMLPSMRGRTVVLLGANVARAFQLGKFSYMGWYAVCNPEDHGDVVVPRLTVVPHPSGRVRFYNSAANRDVVSKFLRSLASSIT
jgi:uracil-DNA glycosylase